MDNTSAGSFTHEIIDILSPKKTVLVIWDVQKMLVNNIFNKDEFISNTNSLIESARKKSIPIFFTQITQLPDQFQSPVRKFFMSRRRQQLSFTPDGLDLSIRPEPNDTVLYKNTADIFIGTNFELMIRNAGISTIVFSGIATEMGVESSARAASNRGFYPVIITDAVSSFDREAHSRSLENLKNMMILFTAKELDTIWNKE